MRASAANLVVPPLIWRELLAAYRRHDPCKARRNVSWVGAGIAAVILVANFFGAPFGFAQTLHEWLFYYGLYLAVPNALQLTGGMFAQERQNQCFGFLFLAGLGMPEIFISKLAGSLLIAATELLALAPFLSIPFLAGGISFALFSATLVVLPTLLLFALALSAFGSALCEEESTAKAVSVGVGAVLCLLVPAIYWLKEWSGHRIPDHWLLLSPAYAPWLIAFGLKTHSGIEVWRACGLTVGWSLILFTAAAFALRQTWRRETRDDISRNSRLQSFWYGLSGRKNRRAWLDTNPMTWLAASDPHPERVGWTALAILVLLWLAGWALAARYWLNTAVFFLTATIFDGLFSSLFCYAAAKFMADQRRSSALELLLTTPLPDAHIVDGQYSALRARFHNLLAAITSLNVTLMLAGLFLRPMNWRALTVYFLIWTVLIAWPILRWRCPPWKVIWRALCCGQPFLAMRARSGAPVAWFVNLINLRHALSSSGIGGLAFPTGTVVEFVICLVIAVVVFAIMAGQLYRDDWLGQHNELLSDLRPIAAEPLPERNDPRLKKWDRNSRLPSRNIKTSPTAPRPIVRMSRGGGTD